MIPAVVLGSHTIGLGIIRALAAAGVPVMVVYYNRRDMGYLSRYVSRSLFSPHPEEEPEGFVQLLLQLGESQPGSLLLPSDDATLTTVSRNRERLRERFVVACTGWDVTRLYLDKKHCYALAERLGIPAPRTTVPATLAEAERYARQAEYPVVVKPSVGHRYFERFGRKMVRVEDREGLMEACRQAAEAGLEVMLQELIPGDDTHGVNYNSYCWGGESLVEFTAEKIRLAPPGFGVPRVLVSREVEEVMEPGRRMLRALGYEGYSCMEFKRDDRDGSYKFMEVNGRLNLSTLHALGCGINFPRIVYDHMVGGELPRARDFRKGVYWIDMTKDVLMSLRHFRRERYRPMQYLRPYLGPRVFAIFDLRDPLPFLKRLLDLAGEAVGRLAPWRRRGAARERRVKAS